METSGSSTPGTALRRWIAPVALALLLIGALGACSSAGHGRADHRPTASQRAALAQAASRAAQALAASSAFAAANAAYLPPTFAAQLASWQQQLTEATTPAADDRIAAAVSAALAQAQAQVAAIRSISPAEPPALLARGRALVAQAQSDRLDPGPAPAVAGSLAAALAAGHDPRPAAAQLATDLAGLQALLDLNDQVGAQLHALMPSVEQAYAERTPGGVAEQAQYQAMTSAFAAAATGDQLHAVQAQAQALDPTVNADLAANRCGHPVPAGRVIALDLTAQEIVFYEDGCAVRATPATSGRPQLRTPTGSFAIFAKYSPFIFRSPWPPGSPFWYPTSPVSYAMEFARDGYFLHDAPWEPDSQMGPGSEDGAGASHGCVHIPHDVMAWAYSWAGIGTPFIVTA